MPPPLFTPSEWSGIRLAVFDVDGTLYRQRPVRLRMARDMLLHAIFQHNLTVIAVLAKYRRIKERLSDEQVDNFEPILIAATAAATGASPEAVRRIVSEWIDQRPLRYVAASRYPGLPELFAGLRSAGKLIGVLSDYPATAKLLALKLTASHIVFTGDKGVGIPKPHPRGIETLIRAAGVTPGETLVIGDRVERDGLAGYRAGARVLIRSSKGIEGWQTFKTFYDPIFAPVLDVGFDGSSDARGERSIF
jgi:FMN phosphatase YigB (HAD superfamily)